MLKDTERRNQDTIIAIIKSARNKSGSASWWKTTNYILRNVKIGSTALDFDTWKRWINISQLFAGTRTISLRERQKLEERHHWGSPRISCMEYYGKQETHHLEKMEYPPMFSERMHINLHSHSSTSLITVSHKGSFPRAWRYPKSFLYLRLQRPEIWMIQGPLQLPQLCPW